jgi:DNA (cytosine-5)-methyltransferase 1
MISMVKSLKPRESVEAMLVAQMVSVHVMATRCALRVRNLTNKPPKKAWMTVRDAIADLPVPTKREKMPGHWQHPGATAYANHTGSNLDEPAKALKAGDHGVPGGENMLADRRGNVRYFTVREMARLQDMPDNFIVRGSWKAATGQLGNAVPTTVGTSMGKAVYKILQSKGRKSRG